MVTARRLAPQVRLEILAICPEERVVLPIHRAAGLRLPRITQALMRSDILSIPYKAPMTWPLKP